MFLCSHYSVLHLLCGDSLLSLFSDLIWNKAIGSLPLKKEQFIWPFFKMVPADVTAENSTNRPRMWLFKLGQSSLRPFIKMAWKHLGLEAIERNSVMLVSKLLVLPLGLIRKKVIWSLKRQGNSISLLFLFFFFLTCQFSESQFLVYATFRCCEYHSISSVWAPSILWILRVLSVLLVGTYTNRILLTLSLWLISVPCNESMYVGTVVHCNFQEKVALKASGTDSLLS